jgi:hypothetical protein
MQTTNLTGGRIENATRIDSCCWLDGNDDELIIEFWYMPGSILRTEYNRRTTVHRARFLNVHAEAEAFDRIMRMAEGQFSQYVI